MIFVYWNGSWQLHGYNVIASQLQIWSSSRSSPQKPCLFLLLTIQVQINPLAPPSLVLMTVWHIAMKTHCVKLRFWQANQTLLETVVFCFGKEKIISRLLGRHCWPCIPHENGEFHDALCLVPKRLVKWASKDCRKGTFSSISATDHLWDRHLGEVCWQLTSTWKSLILHLGKAVLRANDNKTYNSNHVCAMYSNRTVNVR